jgi:hypothetical protein
MEDKSDLYVLVNPREGILQRRRLVVPQPEFIRSCTRIRQCGVI